MVTQAHNDKQMLSRRTEETNLSVRWINFASRFEGNERCTATHARYLARRPLSHPRTTCLTVVTATHTGSS